MEPGPHGGGSIARHADRLQPPDHPSSSDSMRPVQQSLVVVGNTLTLIGCLGLALGAMGVVDPEHFAIGLSSGVRVIGSVAIAGCLSSAIGYGLEDLQDS